MQYRAEVFLDDGRQAIRLPDGVHIAGEEVLLRQDGRTGAITLQPRDERSEQERHRSWQSFLGMLAEIPQEERDRFVIPRDAAPPEVRKTLR
jgi:virulence-associated protein VagC